MNKILLGMGSLLFSTLLLAAEPSAYIISPANGSVVSNPVTVKFGLKNYGVAPAGIVRENTGHHHLLIDTPLPELNKPIAADAKHVHFGAGQTEAEIQLAPGKHTLQLLLGDHLHTPHQKPIYSDVITITVK